MKELSAQHQKFVDELFKNGFNQSQAAISAGYSAKTARSQSVRLINDVNISEHIKLRREELSRDYIPTMESVLRDLKEAKLMAKEKEDTKSLLKAIELEGKYLALWTEKHQVQAEVKTETIEDYLKRISKT
jgi:phage terminase small subunit